MKANAAQIARAVAAPPTEIRFYLLHGPDEAGAAALAATLGGALGSGAERVDVTGAQLRGQPGRLAEEAASLSLFGDRRWVRAAPVGEESVEAATLLLRAPRAEHPVVLIAPTLKTTSKLVKLAIAEPRAMAFACYVPEGRDAERMVSVMAQELGLRCGEGVPARLAAATGADRAVLARELDKLALYLDAAPDRPAVLTEEVLDACGAALEEGDTGPVIAATVSGDGPGLAAALSRYERAGQSGVPLLRQLARRLILLAELRGAIDGGEGIDAVLERHRVFFKEKPATVAALRRWTTPALQAALVRVRSAERRLMDGQGAGEVVAQSEAVAVARIAAARG